MSLLLRLLQAAVGAAPWHAVVYTHERLQIFIAGVAPLQLLIKVSWIHIFKVSCIHMEFGIAFACRSGDQAGPPDGRQGVFL